MLQGSGGISPPSAINNHTQNHSSCAGAGKQSQPRGSLKYKKSFKLRRGGQTKPTKRQPEIHKIIHAAPGRANEASKEASLKYTKSFKLRRGGQTKPTRRQLEIHKIIHAASRRQGKKSPGA
ncbi:hypothetical protein [Raoultella terrigena]|uniref:hypothetical protein n=1 Tax=Raoultella terrigena TaxID=577 RepID=UPI001D0FCA44|nr:hypothetical protein [Raoultella terrigena]